MRKMVNRAHPNKARPDPKVVARMESGSWFPAKLDETGSALVSAPPERVLGVTRAWAKDLGLVEIGSDASSVTFSFTRWSTRPGGFKIRVSASPDKRGQTKTVFIPNTGNDSGGSV